MGGEAAEERREEASRSKSFSDNSFGVSSILLHVARWEGGLWRNTVLNVRPL